MAEFTKVYFDFLNVVVRSLETDSDRKKFILVISGIVKNASQANIVKCTQKDLMKWSSLKQDSIRKLSAQLTQSGFWTAVKDRKWDVEKNENRVVIKRGLYMINPSVLNSLPSEKLGKLHAIYRSWMGKKIKIPETSDKPQVRVEKSIDKVYENEVYESQVREKKMELAIEVLQKQLEIKDKQIDRIVDVLERAGIEVPKDIKERTTLVLV